MQRCCALRSWIAVALLAWSVQSLTAGPERLEGYEFTTDRPDQSDSSVVVPLGVLQVEAGVKYSDVRDAAHTITWTKPSLLRYGIAPGWELRLGGDGYMKQRTVAGSVTGFSDPQLGFKRDLPGDNAVIVAATLPVGKDALSSGRADYTAILAMDRDLPKGWGLGFNVGGTLVAIPNDDSRFFQTFVSAAFSHDLGNDWGGFIDLYGFRPAQPHGGEIVSLQAGVTKLLKPHLQLDFYVDFGLVGAANHRIVGAGLSYAR